MARLFDITTTTDAVNLEPSGRGKLVFTVTNTTSKPQRASLRVRGLDSSQASWFSLSGDTEREFSPNFTHQVELMVTVPIGTPPAKFRVRVDALSVANPDDDFTEGPPVSVTLPPTAPPPPKPSMWWVWLIVAVVLLAVMGAITALVMNKKPSGPAATDPPASTPTTPTPPVTREFNDPRLPTAEGAMPLDVCREWGVNCGKPAADAFCQANGMGSAVDFRIAMDSPPTAIISSKAICRDATCDRITWVNCSASGRLPRIVLNAETLQHLRHLRLSGKQVPE